jgi:hypothetical protein
LGAKVVVAAHPTDSIVMEDAMIIAIMLSVAGVGFLCWLAFNLAVYALPFFAAVAGGLFAYHRVQVQSVGPQSPWLRVQPRW